MSKLRKAMSSNKRGNSKKKTKREEACVEPVRKKGDQSKPPMRSRARRNISPPKPKPVSEKKDQSASVEESEVVKAARKQLKPIVEKLTKGRPANIVGLILAVVNQQTGNHNAANLLIDEYQLDKLFNIKKF